MRDQLEKERVRDQRVRERELERDLRSRQEKHIMMKK